MFSSRQIVGTFLISICIVRTGRTVFTAITKGRNAQTDPAKFILLSLFSLPSQFIVSMTFLVHILPKIASENISTKWKDSLCH